MDKDVIIRVEGLSKRYTLGAASDGRYVALRDVLAQGARRLVQRTRRVADGNGSPPPAAKTDFWALRDVNFEVRRGEVVGIVGRNGAGKSTLLKILSRITEPTQGRISLKGRVASLLEVGTGFHPELTGRENIYLNGAVLGMHRSETRAKFDEIVAFAEVERFLDTPVKRYSSGMYVRLAFAVAAHLEPEILIVDEVLAVGDANFQKKCLGKMRQVAEGEGRTVLFVSHQMNAIEKLCTRAIVFGSGSIMFDGGCKEAIRIYLSELKTEVASAQLTKLQRRGNGTLTLTTFALRNGIGQPLTAVRSGDETCVVLGYECAPGVEVKSLIVGISIHSQSGEALTVFYSDYVGHDFAEVPSVGEITCRLPNFPFSPGQYYVGTRVVVNGFEADWPQDFVGAITVEAGDFYGTGPFGQHGLGHVLVQGSWDVQPVSR